MCVEGCLLKNIFICVCVCVNKWVCFCARILGRQRIHCDMVVSLEALESGTLSLSETQTIYNSRLVLILSEDSISRGHLGSDCREASGRKTLIMASVWVGRTDSKVSVILTTGVSLHQAQLSMKRCLLARRKKKRKNYCGNALTNVIFSDQHKMFDGCNYTLISECIYSFDYNWSKL